MGWAARLLLAGLLVILALSAFALAAVPDALRTPDAVFLPPVILVLAAVYALAVLWLRPDSGPGALCGVLAALMWCAEIYVGGPALLDRQTEVQLGRTFVLTAVACTLVAGPIAAVRSRSPASALRAGVLSGLLSGELVFAFGLVMTLTTLDALASRADYQAELARSKAPSMGGYLVLDILTAMSAHLVINAALGLIGGVVGALISRDGSR